MNLNANWQLKIRDKVWKDVAEFPKKDQERIESVIENETVWILILATLKK